ncbi:MAG: VanZ family protein [Butyrivibrio sp.]|uniref:VanZ family protein n=1 Tax=Butyrivibrio sp. TaxID=28121 RepID=UPI0025C1A1DF|nr:VanZ family protein [Butyrivibrio sp.]MBQ6587413.1 VanZ family protein [Butyrivibrio sp.]
MKYFLLYIKQTLRFVLKPLSFVPAIMMMFLIFTFSGQDADASSELSFQVGVKVFSVANETFDKGWSLQRIEQLSEKSQYYIRKTAHFTEYFVLAITVAFPLYVYGIRGLWLVILAGGFCIAFAGLDEYHQSFVAGRSPQKRDVLIDSCGVILGVIVARIIGWTGRMTIFRPLANKA